MPNPGAIRAGRAYVETFVDNSRLVRGLKGASARLKAWGSKMSMVGRTVATAGAAAITPMLAVSKAFATTGSEMAKLSKATGQPVRDLSQLVGVGRKFKIDMEDVAGSVEELQIRLGEAVRDGTGPLAETFKQLGIDAKEFAKLPITEQFAQLADILNDLPASQRQFIADEIIGGDAYKILPMLAQGGDKLRESMKGVATWSEQDAEAALKLQQAMDGLWGVWRQMIQAIGGALAPELTDLANRLAKVAKIAVDWVKENKGLVVSLFKIAAGVTAAGTALLGIGVVVTAAGVAIGGLVSVLGVVASAVGATVAAIFSPVGAALAAIVGVGAALLKHTETGRRALKALGDELNRFKDFAMETWRGIANALAAGDLMLAGKIAFKALVVEVRQFVRDFMVVWEKAKWNFIATWTEAYTMLAKMGVNAWSTIRKAFVETVAGMTKLWHSFMKNIGNLWNNAQKWMGNMLLDALEKVGVLSESTADMAREEMNRDLDKQIGDREKNRQKGIDEAEQQRQAEIAKIEDEQGVMLDDLDRQRQRRYEALNEQYGQDVADAQRALDEAREQWQASLDKSEEKAAGADGKEPDYDTKRKEEELKAVDLDKTAAEVSSSRGTFNAMALLGLQSTGPQERTAVATEQTAKNTKKLLDEEKRSKLAFA